MTEYSKAFVIGGWSEDHAFLEGLTREISEGPNRIVAEAESLTLAEALKNIDALNHETPRRIVVVHSAGMMAVREAGLVVALNGAEPTPLGKTIWGGIKVATNSAIGREEYANEPRLTSGIIEVLRHPSTLAIPLRVRKFSTVQTLIRGSASFPDGRVYLPSEDDEFGFGSNGEVDLANRHGVTAQMLEGWHNQHLLHPRAGAEQIKKFVNASN
jgi:hypothetical protein